MKVATRPVAVRGLWFSLSQVMLIAEGLVVMAEPVGWSLTLRVETRQAPMTHGTTT